MLRLLLNLWVAFVVTFAALPLVGLTAWAEQGCGGCACDTVVLGEEHPAEGDEETEDTCPPQCPSCLCVLQVVGLNEPGWVEAPSLQAQVIFVELIQVLIPGEPQPIFTPPKHA